MYVYTCATDMVFMYNVYVVHVRMCIVESTHSESSVEYHNLSARWNEVIA